MGWVVFPFSDAVKESGDSIPTAITHGGEWVGFQAIMVLVPEEELGGVVLLNKSDPASGSAFSNLGWNISLLALELDPVNYPAADFITRYGRGAHKIIRGVFSQVTRTCWGSMMNEIVITSVDRLRRPGLPPAGFARCISTRGQQLEI